MNLDREKLLEKLARHPIVQEIEAQEHLEEERKDLGRKRSALLAQLQEKKIAANLAIREADDEVERARKFYETVKSKRADITSQQHAELFFLERSINEIAAELHKTAPQFLVDQLDEVKRKIDDIYNGNYERRWKTRDVKLWGAVDAIETHIDVEAVHAALADLKAQRAMIERAIRCE